MTAFDLAVVGGGPGGLATVLAAEAQRPEWRIAWWRGAAPGFLPAYGGNHPVHRLNVPVERMGLDAEAPVDFLDWLRAAHPSRAVRPGDFVPRAWFGEYLAHRAARVRATAVDADVVDLRRTDAGWALEGAGGRAATSRRVVLAVGLPAPLPMPGAPPHWVGDPWAWWRMHAKGPLPLPSGGRVLIVGSGLTAVDMVLGLRARGFGGHIEVVSTGGRWSTAHAASPPLDPDARERLDEALDAAGSARELLRVLRRAAAGHPWRAVVDALRADTNARWAALDEHEQRRVLRHAFGLWNRHRHRMAPDVSAALSGDVALHLHAGRVSVDGDGRIVVRHAGEARIASADLVLDCRGPGFRAALAGTSLLARLVRGGVLAAHPLGTGVRRPDDPSLAVVGAARFGECFETTAVPELRQQAVEVVRRWEAR